MQGSSKNCFSGRESTYFSGSAELKKTHSLEIDDARSTDLSVFHSIAGVAGLARRAAGADLCRRIWLGFFWLAFGLREIRTLAVASGARAGTAGRIYAAFSGAAWLRKIG